MGNWKNRKSLPDVATDKVIDEALIGEASSLAVSQDGSPVEFNELMKCLLELRR